MIMEITITKDNFKDILYALSKEIVLKIIKDMKDSSEWKRAYLTQILTLTDKVKCGMRWNEKFEYSNIIGNEIADKINFIDLVNQQLVMGHSVDKALEIIVI